VVRTLLTWRWAALTLVLVASVVAMVMLGAWQWDRSVPEPARAAVDLADLDADGLPSIVELAGTSGAALVAGVAGELVSVRGTWREDRTLLVADQALDSTDGRWVLTAVEVQAPEGTALVPVVRGWLPAEAGSPAQVVAAPPGTGEVTVVGWLQQSDPLDLPVDIVQPDGVVPLLASADLANRWPEDLVPGFVVAAPTPDQVAATDLTVLPGPPAEDTAAKDWRNLAYSAQWFVFAGFAVVLWWRMLRDDAARQDPDRRDLPDEALPHEDLPEPAPRERSTTT